MPNSLYCCAPAGGTARGRGALWLKGGRPWVPKEKTEKQGLLAQNLGAVCILSCKLA